MTTTRDRLREEAFENHGYIRRSEALRNGASPAALDMLVTRGALERSAHGVYRDPVVPPTEHDELHLAVLWTGVDTACLSHETALALYELSDLIPDRIHVTIPRKHRIRRRGGDRYQVHHEDLLQRQIGWAEQIPTVDPATAIAQCIDYGTPTYLLRQAIDQALGTGRLTAPVADNLRQVLERRERRH
ncbi:Transcriptional regulator, AbiEi antitoxin, Type IV TA system [Sanguibacter gelidistatuariae]|uniref:Transcriptional regulator, AbiEi antitoxin, Type IV TA system n=1 Tax=Sanguibacter gelidistatuariae TaxID=1814289 RepID=A0A1G6H610_9MICO|nr:type IV toxin-antitoxin system AbiEi family antitoxin domain-containing protein [Sanguibacter gelidistatuariae]SDB89641.1 Transcriptional regulator, AbiEi antitoxin, Type IV TA system [Sanguibacter gelidistatuariae]